MSKSKANGRIDPDYYERSPSTDWRGVRVAFHVTDGENMDRRAELPPRFAKDFLEVST